MIKRVIVFCGLLTLLPGAGLAGDTPQPRDTPLRGDPAETGDAADAGGDAARLSVLLVDHPQQSQGDQASEGRRSLATLADALERLSVSEPLDVRFDTAMEPPADQDAALARAIEETADLLIWRPSPDVDSVFLTIAHSLDAASTFVCPMAGATLPDEQLLQLLGLFPIDHAMTIGPIRADSGAPTEAIRLVSAFADFWTGDYGAALKTLEASGGSSRNLLLLRGIALLRSNELERAQKTFDELLERDSEDVDAIVGLLEVKTATVTKMEDSDLGSTFERLARVAPLDIRTIGGSFSYALAMLSSGAEERAVPVLEALLDNLCEGGGRRLSPEVQELVLAASLASDSKLSTPSLAVRALKCPALRPADRVFDVDYRLATCTMGLADEADPRLCDPSSFDASQTDPLFYASNLTRIEADRKPEENVKTLLELARADPALADRASRWAFALDLAGADPAESIEFLEQSVDPRQTVASDQQALAMLQLRAGDVDAANQALRRAAQLNPDCADIRRLQAQLLLLSGDAPSALDWIDEDETRVRGAALASMGKLESAYSAEIPPFLSARYSGLFAVARGIDTHPQLAKAIGEELLDRAKSLNVDPQIMVTQGLCWEMTSPFVDPVASPGITSSGEEVWGMEFNSPLPNSSTGLISLVKDLHQSAAGRRHGVTRKQARRWARELKKAARAAR